MLLDQPTKGTVPSSTCKGLQEHCQISRSDRKPVMSKLVLFGDKQCQSLWQTQTVW